MVTAAATPSTTGTPVRLRICSSSPAMPPQPSTITSAFSSATAALPAPRSLPPHGGSSSSSTPSPLARTEAQRASSPASFSLSSISGTVRSSVVITEYLPQEHRGTRGRLGDVHHRLVQQLLQPLTAVFAVAGLDDGVERFRIGSTRSITPMAAR